VIWLLLACGSSEVDPLAPLPEEAGEALAACEAQAYPELATTCRVEAAARAAVQGKPDVAEKACAALEGNDRWFEECHFRAGEEFGRQGQLEPALAHCGSAGKYSNFCLTHLAWKIPPLDLDQADAAAVSAAWTAEEARWNEALAGADSRFATEAKALLDARFWFNLYVGVGKADPAAAKAVGLPASRQGFATEAVRLLVPKGQPVPDDLVDRVRAVWDGTSPPLAGPSVPVEHRHGRYHPPISVAPYSAYARLPLYGGNERIVAPDPADDLVVAVLEGLYFLPDVPADAFVPFLKSESEPVRWTAARLVRVTPSATVDHTALLTEMAASADPGLAAHGKEGLQHKEWTQFTGGPRPGERKRGPPPPGRGP
jgi:hypothetical protein